MPTRPVRLDAENNPGKARWCTRQECLPNGVPGRLECTKQRSKGRGQCHAPAIRGTDSCKIHSGFSRQVARARGDSAITAWEAVADAGRTGIDPAGAVLGMLQMTWLRLAAYSKMLERQVATDGDTAEGADLDAPNSSGLIGHRYGAAGKDGHIFAQGEEIRALVILEAQERDRVVKYAKTAHDMGISDRLTSLAERWGDIVAGKITSMLDALDLSPEQQALVPALVESHLGSIDMTAMGGEGVLEEKS